MVAQRLTWEVAVERTKSQSGLAAERADIAKTVQAAKAANETEIESAQKAKLAQFLHRRELNALVTEFKRTESAAKTLATGVQPVGINLQKITDVMQTLGGASSALQGPMGGVSSRLRSLGALAGEAEGGMGLLGVAVGGLVVATAAAVVGMLALEKEFLDLTVQTAEWQGKLFDVSQQLGISVETLSALEIVAKTTGSSLEQIVASLGIFQKNLEASHDPTSKQAELLENLGISATNTEDALRQSLKVLAAMPEGYRQTAVALELFGRGGKSVLAILKETNGDLDGAIKRFREMGILVGTDAAKAADKFNDQLAFVGFQLRAITALIVQDSIPNILKALEDFSRVLNENQEAIRALGKVVTFIVKEELWKLETTLKIVTTVVHDLEVAWDGVRAAALLASGDIVGAAKATADALEKSRKFAEQKSSTSESTPTIPTLPGLASNQVSAVQRAQLTALKQVAEDTARVTRDQISQAQIAFRQGQITREQESAAIIKAERTRRDAALASINAEIEKQQRIRATQEGLISDQRKTDEEIAKLQQQARNINSDFFRKEAEEEARSLEERNKAFIAHLDNQITLRKKADDAAIQLIESRVKTGEILAQAGEDEIERIENSGLEARREVLKQELQLARLDIDTRNRITQQRAELEQEATEVARQQSERRKQIAQDEVEFEKGLILGRLDAQLRLGSISDNAQIASLKALAALRIKTEEETEKAILAIRLAAIDREADAVRARLTAAGSITDPKARKQAEEQYNADLRVLQAERQALSEQGERDVEDGRQRDIDSRKRYVASIRSLDDRIRDGELEQRRRELEGLAEREGLNQQVIALFRQLTLDEEAEHHKRIVNEINAQEAEAHAVDVGGKNKLEIEQKYNELREQENKRFHDRQADIDKKAARDKAFTGPVGGFLKGGGFSPGVLDMDQMAQSIEKFGQTATTVFTAVLGATQALAQGIGEMVGQWVLLGSEADISMQKLVATVLAGVATQAATLAVFETALGIAALTPFGAVLYGSAAQHFQAALLFASIAVGAALIGRAVAGNSFSRENDSRGKIGGPNPSGGGGGSSPPAQPQTRSIGRSVGAQPSQPVQVDVHVHATVDEGVQLKAFTKNYGKIRKIIGSDGVYGVG